MTKYLSCCVLMVLVGGCASGMGPRTLERDGQQERSDSIEPIDESKSVCGYSDTGRWECDGSRGPAKKPKSKFSTEFKKGPPKEQDNKLPRGDKPFDATPIEDSGSSSGAPTDEDYN